MINDDTRKALAAALEALSTAEQASRAARELIRTIEALATAVPLGPVWLEDVDVVRRFPPITRRMFLDAHRAGLLDSMRVGRKILATEASVLAWLEKRRGGAPPKVA